MYISDDLVTRIGWTHASSIHGCCGIGHLIRLQSNNVTIRQRDQDRVIWANDKKAKARQLQLKTGIWTLRRWVETLRYRYDGARLKNPLGNDNPQTKAFAIPKEIAFASVCEDMKGSHQSIYLLTDNVSEEGDYCHGHFSPRAFARWFRNENIGSVVTTGPVKSLTTAANIQGWFICPNWPTLNTHVRSARSWLTEDIDNANKEGTLKNRDEQRRKERAVEVATITERFTSNW